MPIYEYRCGACDQCFERLVRGETVVACPANFSSLGPPKSGGCGGGGCGCH